MAPGASFLADLRDDQIAGNAGNKAKMFNEFNGAGRSRHFAGRCCGSLPAAREDCADPFGGRQTSRAAERPIPAGIPLPIDENLARQELADVKRSRQLCRRKEIYEQLHPETANGGDRRSDRQSGELKGERFTKATAAATGQSERVIQRAVARGKALGDDLDQKTEGNLVDAIHGRGRRSNANQ